MRGVFNSQLGKKPNLAKDGSLASIPNARFVSMQRSGVGASCQKVNADGKERTDKIDGVTILLIYYIM
jgi:hypothetical protein